MTAHVGNGHGIWQALDGRILKIGIVSGRGLELSIGLGFADGQSIPIQDLRAAT